MNSSKLQSSHRTSKLPVYNSPREYISVFAVRVTPSLLATLPDAPLGWHITIPGINPRATDILHLTEQERRTFSYSNYDVAKSGIFQGVWKLPAPNTPGESLKSLTPCRAGQVGQRPMKTTRRNHRRLKACKHPLPSYVCKLQRS